MVNMDNEQSQESSAEAMPSPISVDGVRPDLEALDDLASDLRGLVSLRAQGVEQVSNALRDVEVYHVTVAQYGPDELSLPDVATLIQNANRLTAPFRDYVRRENDTAAADLFRAHEMAGTAAIFGSIAHTTGALVEIEEVLASPRANRKTAEEAIKGILPSTAQIQDLAARLAGFDAPLGGTYRQLWQVYAVTRYEPERGALFFMRQTLDHFFGVVAPDEAVRQSEYWQPKNGDKPELVSRPERFCYAAHQWGADSEGIALLDGQVSLLRWCYDQLQHLHARGILNRRASVACLELADRLLRRWADALWPGYARAHRLL